MVLAAMPVKRSFRSRNFAGNPSSLRPRGAYQKNKFLSNFSKKRKSFAARVKAVVLRTCEPKDLNFNYDKGELYHNVMQGVCMNNQSGQHPVLGTGDSNRIGDKINVSGYMLRILWGQKADRPNVTFRWSILEVNKGAPFVYNDWFENISGNILLDPWNKDYVRQLKGGTIRPNNAALAAGGGREYTFTTKIWVPFKKQFTYGPGDGASYCVTPAKDLYFMFGAYDAHGTLISDNIAYIALTQTMYYKDP